MATIEASAVETTYDTVPYPSYPFPQTHPDRLATIATLFGLKPAPVERCRVLDLGCASGGNRIPMAATLPESTSRLVRHAPNTFMQGDNLVLRRPSLHIECRKNFVDTDLPNVTIRPIGADSSSQ